MSIITTHISCLEYDSDKDHPNIFLVHGTDKAIQIDAGASPEHHQEFLAAVSKAGLQQPGLCLITHWHWDHTFAIPAVKVPVVASTKTNEYLARCETWEWTDAAMRSRIESGEDIEFCDQMMRVCYPDCTRIHPKRADLEVNADFRINLGDVHVQALLRDTPRTRDAMLFFVEEDRALIAGDAECPDYYDYAGNYDPARLSAYIKFLESLDFDIYLRGHDDPTTMCGCYVHRRCAVADSVLTGHDESK